MFHTFSRSHRGLLTTQIRVPTATKPKRFQAISDQALYMVFIEWPLSFHLRVFAIAIVSAYITLPLSLELSIDGSLIISLNVTCTPYLEYASLPHHSLVHHTSFFFIQLMIV